MEKLGYGPAKRLDIKVSARDISYLRDQGSHRDRPG